VKDNVILFHKIKNEIKTDISLYYMKLTVCLWPWATVILEGITWYFEVQGKLQKVTLLCKHTAFEINKMFSCAYAHIRGVFWLTNLVSAIWFSAVLLGLIKNILHQYILSVRILYTFHVIPFSRKVLPNVQTVYKSSALQKGSRGTLGFRKT